MDNTKYIGNGIFGRAYQVMYLNDVHALGSIDRELVNQMILLNEETKDYLYESYTPIKINVKTNRKELEAYLLKLKSKSEKETVHNILMFLSEITLNYDVDIEEMEFGGIEEDIISRGTDWCTDIARCCCVLLQLAGIPSRIVNTVQIKKAYHGHVVVEAFYENHWGVLDPTYGVMMYEQKPLSAAILLKQPDFVRKCFSRDYPYMSDDFHPEEQYDQVAIVNYFVDDMSQYDYTKSTLNEYTRKIIHFPHNGKWFMGEGLSTGVENQ